MSDNKCTYVYDGAFTVVVVDGNEGNVELSNRYGCEIEIKNATNLLLGLAVKNFLKPLRVTIAEVDE